MCKSSAFQRKSNACKGCVYAMASQCFETTEQKLTFTTQFISIIVVFRIFPFFALIILVPIYKEQWLVVSMRICLLPFCLSRISINWRKILAISANILVGSAIAIVVVLSEPKLPITIRTHSNITIQCFNRHKNKLIAYFVPALFHHRLVLFQQFYYPMRILFTFRSTVMLANEIHWLVNIIHIRS